MKSNHSCLGFNQMPSRSANTPKIFSNKKPLGIFISQGAYCFNLFRNLHTTHKGEDSKTIKILFENVLVTKVVKIFIHFYIFFSIYHYTNFSGKIPCSFSLYFKFLQTVVRNVYFKNARHLIFLFDEFLHYF